MKMSRPLAQQQGTKRPHLDQQHQQRSHTPPMPPPAHLNNPQPRRMPPPEITIQELSSQETAASTNHRGPQGAYVGNKPKFVHPGIDQRRNVAPAPGAGQNPQGRMGMNANRGGMAPQAAVTMAREEAARRMQKQQQQARAPHAAQGQTRPAGFAAQRSNESGLAPPQGMPAHSGAAPNNVMAGQQRMIRPMPARAQQQPQQRAPQLPRAAEIKKNHDLNKFVCDPRLATPGSMFKGLRLDEMWNQVMQEQNFMTAFDAFGDSMDKAMGKFNSLIQQYNGLSSKKNVVLAAKQDLTKCYLDGGAHLSEQCTELHTSTRQIRMTDPKRMRMVKAAPQDA